MNETRFENWVLTVCLWLCVLIHWTTHSPAGLYVLTCGVTVMALYMEYLIWRYPRG